jgi:hypothetical protein
MQATTRPLSPQARLAYSAQPAMNRFTSNRNTSAFKMSRNCNKTLLIPFSNRNNNSDTSINFSCQTFLIVAIAIRKHTKPLINKG